MCFPNKGATTSATTVERVYARLKDEFGGRHVRVRGHAKVLCHLMFGILALAVSQFDAPAATAVMKFCSLYGVVNIPSSSTVGQPRPEAVKPAPMEQ